MPLQKPPLASISARQRRSSAGTWSWLMWSTARFWKTQRAKALRIWQRSCRELWVLTCLLFFAPVSSPLSSSRFAVACFLQSASPFCHWWASQKLSIFRNAVEKCPSKWMKMLPDAWGITQRAWCYELQRRLCLCGTVVLSHIRPEKTTNRPRSPSGTPTSRCCPQPMCTHLSETIVTAAHSSANWNWTMSILPPAGFECVQAQV